MAGAECAAGPAPDVRHQPPGKALYVYCNYYPSCNYDGSVVVKHLADMNKIVGPSTDICKILLFVIFVHSNMILYIPCMYIVHIWSEHVCTLKCIPIVCSCIYTV